VSHDDTVAGVSGGLSTVAGRRLSTRAIAEQGCRPRPRPADSRGAAAACPRRLARGYPQPRMLNPMVAGVGAAL